MKSRSRFDGFRYAGRWNRAFLLPGNRLFLGGIALVLASLLLASCASDYCNRPPQRTIRGQVVDADGHAVGGVVVRVSDRPVGVTDEKGAFLIRVAAPADRLAVSFIASKFVPTTRIISARADGGGTVVVVWPRAASARLDAGAGGKLEFPGAAITFPPDAFVDMSGRRVTGDVAVSLSAVDVKDPRQLASAPGDFTARMRDGSVRSLETFGLFELDITDPAGRNVQFAPGRAARVDLTAPKQRRDLPPSVGSFSFDARDGRWIPQGRFELAPGPIISAPVDAAGWWNADQPYDTTCLKVQVLGCNGCEGTPGRVSGALVTATGSDYVGAPSIGRRMQTASSASPQKRRRS
ncbi:MAG: hypothetical protein JOZ54_19250 [Acidobacteria bacterium]|nr:hypothetical protein [Acidobacteriota bacterium]